jgi:DNA-binding GntR family transcriptional regulator
MEKLREAILAGVFRPGDRLVEADLCASLGVSRPSLREALRGLQAEQLVEIIPNRGPQIPILSWQDAEEIYDVRALLEGEAAALCASAAKPEDIATLRDALAQFQHAERANDSSGRLQATGQFYAVILHHCGNALIGQLLDSLLARINFLRERSMSLPGRASNSLDEMTAIYNAIKRKDAVAARKAVQEHVKNARNAAEQAFRQKINS